MFLLSKILVAPSTGSSLRKEQVSESHLHSVNTVKAVFRLEEVPLPEPILITDDPHMSLQQQAL